MALRWRLLCATVPIGCAYIQPVHACSQCRDAVSQHRGKISVIALSSGTVAEKGSWLAGFGGGSVIRQLLEPSALPFKYPVIPEQRAGWPDFSSTAH